MAIPTRAPVNDLQTKLTGVARELLAHCRSREWSGYDPYDGLETPLMDHPPFRNSRHLRLVVTQLLKRSPINLRPMLRIEKSRNPKALALFLSATVMLSRMGLLQSLDPVFELIDLLLASRSSHPRDCWGYPFPWQTRTQLVPKGQPNLVCTVFAGQALLDAYELIGDSRCLEMAEGAARFIKEELCFVDGDGHPSFAYPLPTSRAPVHNANLLGAALLCRIHRHGRSPQQQYQELGLHLARHAAGRQHPDGSWSYGEAPHWRWVDNFHTGFNLSALRSVSVYAATSEFDPTLAHGFEFYRRNFFLDSGAPRYRADRTYPIDIHSVSQAMITMVDLKHLDPGNVDRAASIYQWADANMLDPGGHFHYQVWPWYTVKISYMRWSQAWMLLAIAKLLSSLAHSEPMELQDRVAA